MWKLQFYVRVLFLNLMVVQNNLASKPSVLTADGSVEGTTMKTGLNKTFYAFRGIPFAQPPIGNLRFEPPVPVKPWTKPVLADHDDKQCVSGARSYLKGTEDCLYLNIYTPTLNASSALSVMIYIHDGFFWHGNITYASYGPEYFMDEGVIVVMINYRTGIFGFLSTGNLVVPGNNGLKDQNVAMKWVAKNIDKFGGDPQKITLWGSGAGAASVAYHQLSPLSKGLFQAAIMQSGSSLCYWAFVRNSKDVAREISEMLSLENKSSETLVNELKSYSYDEVQNLFSAITPEETVLQFLMDGVNFGPVREPEHAGAFYTKWSFEAFDKGDFNKVPTLIGYNSMEVMNEMYLLPYDSSFRSSLLVPIGLGLNDRDTARSTIDQMVIKEYWNDKIFMSLSNEKTYKYMTDDQYIRPIWETALLLTRYIPVYYYQFTYEGALGGASNREVIGTVHGEELNYLFKRNSRGTDHDETVRSQMVKLWANFAKYKNPTPTKEPLLSNIVWPAVDAKFNIDYLNIGRQLKLKINPSARTMNFWKVIYRTYAKHPLDTC